MKLWPIWKTLHNIKNANFASLFCKRIVNSLLKFAEATFRDQSGKSIKSKAVLFHFMFTSYLADVPKCEGFYNVMRKKIKTTTRQMIYWNNRPKKKTACKGIYSLSKAIVERLKRGFSRAVQSFTYDVAA